MSKTKSEIRKDDACTHFDCVLESMHDGVSLRESCKKIGRSKGWFYTFLESGSEEEKARKKDQYACAREAMLDAQAEELEEIGNQAALAATAVEVAGLRLKSDNRKWMLSKLAPKKYGDKVTVGNDPENPMPAAGVLIVPGLASDPNAWAKAVSG
jgi:hypothetical protein